MKNKVVNISDIISVEYDDKYGCLRFYGNHNDNSSVLLEERDVNNVHDVVRVLSSIIESHLLVCYNK